MKKICKSETEKNNPKIKVLHLTPLGSGGISKLTVTINKLISNQIQFDYLVFRDKKEFLEDEALSYGGKKQIINTEQISNTLKKVIWKEKEMISLFKREKYDVVHVDASTPYDVVVAVAAKIAGIKNIIFHSHNDDFDKGNFIRDLFMPVYKQLMLMVVTDYFTISESAAKYMFPKQILKNKKYHLVHNGIHVEEYLYDLKDRDSYRKELNLDNKFVVGHVGRFVYQKNHEFIIDVFEKIYQKNKNSVLLLVGEGELESGIKEIVREKKLTDQVVFFGTTHEIRKVLLAMDAFIFPSHFEGLGIAAIEAQATGLMTFCADTIVDEVNITDCFERIHGWNASEWADCILEHARSQSVRYSKDGMVKSSGYDIKETVSFLEKYYLKCRNKNN